MRVLNASDIAAVASAASLIPVIAAAMRAVSAGEATLPVRSIMPLPGNNRLGVMPGYLGAPSAYGVKLLSLFPDNPRYGRSSHAGLMVIFDPETGLARACLDASMLTALRTAAATAVATNALARADAARLAIIGTGEEAETHIPAIRAVRAISDLVIWGRDPAKAARIAQAHGGRAVATLAVALAGADIVCTVTGSREPFLAPAMLDAGVHLNAIGAGFPAMRELEPECVRDCRIVTDYRPALEAGAWDVIEARARGLIAPDFQITEIGEVLSGSAPGRSDAREKTLYRSMGIAAQDLAAAMFILERAEQAGLGTVAPIP
jgi:alanine dehydrogenase